MLVFDIKIIPWSYFYVNFSCSYKFVHFLPVTFMLISLMILTLYVCLCYSLTSIEGQDNVYDVMPCISTTKSVVEIIGSSYLQIKKSLPLHAYICPCKLVLKGLNNFFLIFLELSFISRICGGCWSVCNLCYSTWLSSSSCSALAHN